MKSETQLPKYACVADDVRMGPRVVLAPFVNLYGCEVGAETRIGAFVEIQRGASIGQRCKISSHSFICEGVTVEDEVFIGHGVVFINDRYPRATNPDGSSKGDGDWRMEPTTVGRRASIGSGAIVMCGIAIGADAIIGAGSLVTHDVPPRAIVAGHPARLRRMVGHCDSHPRPHGGFDAAD